MCKFQKKAKSYLFSKFRDLEVPDHIQKWGLGHILAPGDDLPVETVSSLNLRAKLMLIPVHIAY